MMFGRAFGWAVGLVLGLVFGLLEFAASPSVAQRASSPMASLRGDRTLSVVRAVTFGLVLGLVVGLGFALAVEVAAGLAFVVMFVVVFALAFGLVLGLKGGSWPGFLIASLWLAARRRLPLRLMGFLQDSYRLGLLRIVGSSYQFRHAELQDHLARDSRTQRLLVTGD